MTKADAVAASVTTEEMAVAGQPDPVPMTMVATVAAGKMVKAGDMVVFTYTNAMAPAMPEASMFITEYDGEQVAGDYKVIVQSAAGAAKLALEAADFNIDGGGSTTVTVKLLAADDSVCNQFNRYNGNPDCRRWHDRSVGYY